VELLSVSVSRHAPRRIGRYVLFDKLASGGMSTVHLGRIVGAAGFARTVAIKRAHDRLGDEPEFVRMLIDEGRLAARIQHPNVVQTLDVVADGDELFLIMEYVAGEALHVLWRASVAAGERIPTDVVSAIVGQALLGLHAAHEAVDEQGVPLSIVHRDVSPQNLLVGSDGITRVLDFGIAKAVSRLQSTRLGQVKGKLAYMAPEQLRREPVDRRTDLFATGVVLWELLVGRKLFAGDDYPATIAYVLGEPITHPSDCVPDLPRAVGDVAMRALSRDPQGRYATAMEMALALDATAAGATSLRVAAWVERMAAERLAARAARVREIESAPAGGSVSEPVAPPPPVMTESVATATDLSASRRPVTQPTAPRWRRPALAAALGAIGIAVALAVAPLRFESETAAPASSSSASATAAPEPLPVSAAPPPETPSAAAATGSEPPASPPRAPPAATPRRPSEAPRARPTATAKTPAPSCTPPYTIDASGDKHFKPECFR
jgi:serine/threonine-protein kinase